MRVCQAVLVMLPRKAISKQTFAIALGIRKLPFANDFFWPPTRYRRQRGRCSLGMSCLKADICAVANEARRLD